MRDIFAHGIRTLLLAVIAATSLTSCIDEDLSECGKDYKARYTVQLRTNITTEIDAELTTQIEQRFGADLRTTLADIFTDRARDLDLSFYTDDDRLAQHDTHQMDASQASYTIYLPVRKYQNLALANTAQEPEVATSQLDNLHSMCIAQPTDRDTLDSHVIGLFSARKAMEIEDRDQEFDVDLYMQNCTACLVLDPQNVAISDVSGCVVGLASSFNVCDSTYAFNHSVPIRTHQLRATDNRLIGLYATGFPSRDNLDDAAATQSLAVGGAAVNATDSPAKAEEKALWQIKVYVRLATGKITESTLSIRVPIKAGQLRIIKAAIRDDGGITTTTQNVGVSVKIDWKPGGEHDIEI